MPSADTAESAHRTRKTNWDAISSEIEKRLMVYSEGWQTNMPIRGIRPPDSFLEDFKPTQNKAADPPGKSAA
jgi:hypothetical protein